MIENATVYFTDGSETDVAKVKFKTRWVGIRDGGEWVYYPPRKIDRIVS